MSSAPIKLTICTYANTSASLFDNVLNIFIAAFANDEGARMRFPRQNEYPAEHKQTVKMSFEKDLLMPDFYLVAAEMEGVLVGFAIWQREGENVMQLEEIQQRDSWLQRMELRLLNLQNAIRFNKWVYKSPFDNPVANKRVGEAWERNHKATNAGKESYHLHVLAVLPEYQRRGIGSFLVKWGLEKAEKEGVMVSLEASKSGKSVYERMGFREIGVLNPFHPEEGEIITDDMAKGLHCQEKGCIYGALSIMVVGDDL